MSNLGKSVGACVKGVGSATPQIAVEQYVPPVRQWETTAHYDGTDWWLSVEPGYALTHDQTLGGNITSPNGNRDLSSTKLVLSTPTPDYVKGATVLYKVEKCHCYKGLRYAGVSPSNSLEKQQFKVDSSGDWLVIAYRCTPAYALAPRLAIIKASDWTSYFTYNNLDYSAGTGGFSIGANAVFNYIPVFTTDFAANTGTSAGHTHTYTLRNLEAFKMRVERVSLLARPIALFEGSTGKVFQYTNDILDMTTSPEVTWGAIDTTTTGGYLDQDFIDTGYAAYFYVTGQANAPSGYTFNYT